MDSLQRMTTPGSIAVTITVVVVAAMVGGIGISQWVMHTPRLKHAVVYSGPSMERDSIVSKAAQMAGMPPLLAIAMSHVENWGGDSTATHPVSKAVGILQVLPKMWAHSYTVECGTDSLIGRWRNACVGTHIAKHYFDECGNWDCALVKYVGAECRKTDSPERCRLKQIAGNEYVRDVMRRYGRTDLSPARDAIASGNWRRDITP